MLNLTHDIYPVLSAHASDLDTDEWLIYYFDGMLYLKVGSNVPFPLIADLEETAQVTIETQASTEADKYVSVRRFWQGLARFLNIQNASESQKGFVQEATSAQVAAKIDVGSTGARLFVSPSKILAGEFPNISGNTLYVNSLNANASDAWTRTQALGRADKPFLSLTGAHTAAQNDDTIIVIGNVSQQLTVTKRLKFILQNGTWSNAGSCITTGVGGVGSSFTLINYTINCTGSATTFNHAVQGRVKIEGIGNSKITNTSTGSAIAVRGVSIYNMYFRSESGTTIITNSIGSASESQNIVNCVFYSVSGVAGVFSPSTRTTIQNSFFIGATAGLRTSSALSYFQNCYFEGNTGGGLEHNTNALQGVFDNCTAFSKSASGVVLNQFSNVFCYTGGKIRGATNAVLFSNLFRNVDPVTTTFLGTMLYAGTGLIVSENYSGSDSATAKTLLYNCVMNKAFSPTSPTKFDIQNSIINTSLQIFAIDIDAEFYTL